jgi:hypothetical protein
MEFLKRSFDDGLIFSIKANNDVNLFNGKAK